MIRPTASELCRYNNNVPDEFTAHKLDTRNGLPANHSQTIDADQACFCDGSTLYNTSSFANGPVPS